MIMTIADDTVSNLSIELGEGMRDDIYYFTSITGFADAVEQINARA